MTDLQVVGFKGCKEQEIFGAHRPAMAVGISFMQEGCCRPLRRESEEILHRKQAEKDRYDQIMDEFFELVKEWQIEENGRSARTADRFHQEFPKRFVEMAEWHRKRKGKSANGNE